MMKEANHSEEERQSLLSNEDDDDPANATTFTTRSTLMIKIATITALATTFATFGYVSESKKLSSLLSSSSSAELGYRRHYRGGDADDFSRKQPSSSSYSSSARLGRWSSRDDDEDDRYSSRRSSSRHPDDFDDDDDRRGGRGNYAKYRDEDDDAYEKRGRGQRRDLGKDEDEDEYSKNKHSSSKYDDDDEDDHRKSSADDEEEDQEEEEDPAMKENCVGEAADEEKGIYQYPDKICLTNPSLTPACLGNGGAVTACRFCQTEEAVRKVAGWPQCPHSVCEKSSGIGCIGDSFSKNEISWRMHVKDIAKHNARVKQIGISGTCDSTVSDQAVGRHMFATRSARNDYYPGAKTRKGVDFASQNREQSWTRKKSPRSGRRAQPRCARDFPWRRPIAKRL